MMIGEGAVHHHLRLDAGVTFTDDTLHILSERAWFTGILLAALRVSMCFVLKILQGVGGQRSSSALPRAVERQACASVPGQ